MASYNGLICSKTLDGSTASQVLGSSGVAYVGVTHSVPAKFFSSGQFGIQVSGVSGRFGVEIVGAVGGATWIIAGRTAITAVGGFPIPFLNYTGASDSVAAIQKGIPRPAYVAFGAGATGTVGFTASVFFAGEYN
jgi:hypothetical protein